MNYEEAIETLYQIADEAQDNLNHNRRRYTATRQIEALNVAIGALRKQQERERKENRKTQEDKMEAIKIDNIEFEVNYSDGTRKRVPEGILFEADGDKIIVHNGTNRKEVLFSVPTAAVEFITAFGLLDEFDRYLQENKTEET